MVDLNIGMLVLLTTTAPKFTNKGDGYTILIKNPFFFF